MILDFALLFLRTTEKEKNRSERYNPPKDNDNSWRKAYQVELVQQPNENKVQENRQSASVDYIPKVPQPGATQVQDNNNIFAKN